MFRVKIRVTANGEGESEAARRYLLKRLSGLSLATGRRGNNPKYEGRNEFLAYGDLDIAEDGEPAPVRRRRKSPAPRKGKA